MDPLYRKMRTLTEAVLHGISGCFETSPYHDRQLQTSICACEGR